MATKYTDPPGTWTRQTGTTKAVVFKPFTPRTTSENIMGSWQVHTEQHHLGVMTGTYWTAIPATTVFFKCLHKTCWKHNVFQNLTQKSKNCTHKMQNALLLLQNEALQSKFQKHVSKANICLMLQTLNDITFLDVSYTQLFKTQSFSFMSSYVHFCTRLEVNCRDAEKFMVNTKWYTYQME